MDEFVISVARYLEANDSSLIRAEKRVLYPKLEEKQDLPSSQTLVSDYANYVDFHPTAPPSTLQPTQPIPPINPASIHPPREREYRMPRTRSQSSVAAQGPTHVTHITHHYHSREESQFYRQPTVIVQSPPSTNVFVQSSGSNVEQRSNKQEKEEKKQDDKQDGGSAVLGVALLAGGTAATTYFISKLALSRKELNELMEERKNVSMALISADEAEFIKQFDLTFGELKKSSTVLTGSALSGGGSLLLFGGLVFTGVSNDVVSGVALFTGCAAIASACYGYFFVSDDRNTRCRKLHALAKKIIEKDV